MRGTGVRVEEGFPGIKLAERPGGVQNDDKQRVGQMASACIEHNRSGLAGLRRRALTLTVLLFIGVLTIRGLILFTGQKYLRSDEAVVGLMAKHIVTRGERPLFLYGQHYGGGHAMVAYMAAPLFALFGRLAVLLTAVTLAVSMLNLLLLWLILNRYLDEWIALLGTGLYAFSPPAVYQSFLVNGGTESLCLSLLALMFFLRAYLDSHHPMRNTFIAGIFSGAAYYAMDYALVYVIVFVLLLAATGPVGKWRCLGLFLVGLSIGCLPMIIYNLTHDFINLRLMFKGGPGEQIGFLSHFGGALWATISGDLAAFYTGQIDDFKEGMIGFGSWIHAAIAMIAVVGLFCRQRHSIIRVVRGLSLSGAKSATIPMALIPPVFIIIYLVIYCSAKFSLDVWKTPRYFLPLCPFVSISIVLFLLWERKDLARKVGFAIVLFLMIRGAVVSTAFGLRPCHEEHGITTSGEEIKKLGHLLVENNIKIAYAPYEIQWRLMFETDEEVIVASDLLSPFPRYSYYQEEVRRRTAQGKRFALIFRKDFAFGRLFAPKVAVKDNEIQLLHFRLKLNQLKAIRAGEEFLVFYPLTLTK